MAYTSAIMVKLYPYKSTVKPKIFQIEKYIDRTSQLSLTRLQHTQNLTLAYIWAKLSLTNFVLAEWLYGYIFESLRVEKLKLS